MPTAITNLDSPDVSAVTTAAAHDDDGALDRRRSATTTAPEVEEAGGPSLGAALSILFAMLGFLIGSQVIADNSFFTHLANGRVTLAGGGIPRVDPYSFSAPGLKVTVQSWLATIVYAGLEETAGGSSIRLFNGGLGALISLGLWRLTRPLDQILVRLAFVGSTVAVGAFVWGPRPTLFGLLAFVGLLLVHQRALPMWSLIPIMWLWVNTHGSFPLGLVAIGAIGVGHAIDHREIPAHESRVFGWAFVGMLGGAIGPLGLDLLWFPIHLMSRREALDGVGEWSPPAFDQPLGLLLVAFAGLHIVAAARGARWKALLPGAVFVFASMLAVRNMAPAVLVFAVTLPVYLDVEFGSLRASMRGAIPKGVALASVAGIALFALAVSTEEPVSLDSYPVDEVTWLDDRSLVANPDVHVVHRDTVGNYLELRYGVGASVFVDDRFDFYPIDVLDDHRSLIFGGDYREILDRRRADVVLWDASGAFSYWLAEAPEWDIVVQDDDWLIACRVGSAAASRCSADGA